MENVRQTPLRHDSASTGLDCLALETLEIISDGLYWCDQEAHIVYVNAGACRALGYTKQELLALTVLDIDPGLSMERWRGFWEVLERDGVIELESRHQRRDGTSFPISVTSNRLEYEGKALCCAVVRDISEQKKIKDKLEDSESMFRALFEKGPIGVAYHEMLYDENGDYKDYRFLAANASYQRLTGVNPTGKLVTEAFPGIEKDPFNWIGTFGKVAKTGCEIRFQQYLQSNNRWYDCVGYQSKPDHFVAAFMEITEQKRAEQLLKSKNRELEQILYVASHDLRTPLVNINGYAHEMVNSWNDILGEIQAGVADPRAYLASLAERLECMSADMAFIQQSDRQLDRLMNGLLKVSRLGRDAVELITVDMDALVCRIVASFAFQLRDADGILDVGALPPCQGDPLLLTQIFNNLIGNAIKYREPSRPLRIGIAGGVADGLLHYTVSDNGIGITEKNREKVFELFYRMHPRNSEGDGIGLTIVQQAAERMGGSVYVEATEEVGCRFVIQLPYVTVGGT